METHTHVVYRRMVKSPSRITFESVSKFISELNCSLGNAVRQSCTIMDKTRKLVEPLTCEFYIPGHLGIIAGMHCETQEGESGREGSKCRNEEDEIHCVGTLKNGLSQCH